MRPSQIVFLTDLPRTIQGKVDKARLYLPKESELRLLSENEIAIAKIWGRLLQVSWETLQPNSHFFQLGGHSLTATLMIQEINTQYRITLPAKTLLQFPTIESLTFCIERSQKSTTKSLMTFPKTDLIQVPLSYQQSRLWAYEQMYPGTSTYNLFVAFSLEGTVEVTRLRHAFESLLKKHAVLRMTICEVEGKPIQMIHKTSNPGFVYYDWRNSEEAEFIETRLKQRAYTLAQHHFQLDKDQPIVIQLIHYQTNCFVLFINIHHIACDGWSLRLLLRDLNQIYNDKEEDINITDQQLHYLDYAAWQQTYSDRRTLENAKLFWRSYLQNAKTMKLPYDFFPPQTTRKKLGKRIPFSFDSDLSEKIQIFSRQQGCTTFANMITVFAVLLFCYTRLDRFTIYTVLAGRQLPSTHDLVGFFAQLVPIVFNATEEISLSQLIKRFAHEFSEILTHQEVSWELIQSALSENKPNQEGMNKLLFVQQDAFEYPIQWRGVTAKRIYNDNETLLLSDYDSAKFDLCFYVQWTAGMCDGLVEFDAERFHETTIYAFIKNYQLLLNLLIESSLQPLSKISFYSPNDIAPLAISDTYLNDYPSVIEWLEARCQQARDCYAIVDTTQKISHTALAKPGAWRL